MKKIALIIIANFLFMNGFTNLGNAEDLEKSMNEKAARELYYNQQKHSNPQIIDMDCEINDTEIKPSFDGAVGVGGHVNFELGTKVKSTKISWNLKDDEFLTSQKLTIIDDKSKSRKVIKLDLAVREYTDKQSYTGSMRNGFITGRHYELEVEDEKWIWAGGDRATVDIQFGLMTYYGCSSKLTLNDSDINDFSIQLGIGPYSEKNEFLDITAENQYFFVIYPKKDVTANLSFKYFEGASTYVDASSGLTVHRTGTSFNWPVFTKWILVKKKHKNSSGFISDYNIYRTKEPLNGTYCFTRN